MRREDDGVEMHKPEEVEASAANSLAFNSFPPLQQAHGGISKSPSGRVPIRSLLEHVRRRT